MTEEVNNVLIVDVETTGLDPTSDEIIEFGAVLYSVEHQTTIAQASCLSHADGNPCERINRIPEAAVRDAERYHGVSVDFGAMLEEMRGAADAYVAHNAEFDSAFLRWDDLPWICTCFDVRWPNQTRDGGSLINLALDHGIGVSSAHRALTDCQLIAALFDRVEDLPGAITHAMRPKATFQALVSYDDRELAKDAGFRWDGQKKVWTRRMAIEDANGLPFKVRQY